MGVRGLGFSSLRVLFRLHAGTAYGSLLEVNQIGSLVYLHFQDRKAINVDSGHHRPAMQRRKILNTANLRPRKQNIRATCTELSGHKVSSLE